MSLPHAARAWFWLVHKDLVREWRAPRAVPGMLLLGIVLSALLILQIDLPLPERSNLIGGLYWFASFFAGTIVLDRSLASEREEGCWNALLLYPAPAAAIFGAKLTVNFLALCGLNALLIPAFAVFSGVSLWAHPSWLAAIVLLANLGIAAVGTVTSALTYSLQQRAALLVLLLLPLVSPVVLGAAQATRLLLVDNLAAEFSRWLQLLAGFAGLYVVLGALLFEFVIED